MSSAPDMSMKFVKLKPSLDKVANMSLQKRLVLIFAVMVMTAMVTFLASQELAQLKLTQAKTALDSYPVTTPDSYALELEATQARLQAEAELQAKKSAARLLHLEQNTDSTYNYLAQKKITDKYGIYFQDLKNPDLLYTHNDAGKFAPASIYKVPLTLVTLKQVEAGRFKLTDKLSNGYTVLGAIETMLKDSANWPMTPLENKNGGYKRTQSLITDELGIEVKRVGQITSAQAIAKAFNKLYAGDYLSKEHNEIIIGYLLNASSRNRDRIPAGGKE